MAGVPHRAARPVRDHGRAAPLRATRQLDRRGVRRRRRCEHPPPLDHRGDAEPMSEQNFVTVPITTDSQTLADDAVDRLRVTWDGWEPNDGDLEVVQIEALA